MRSNDLSFCFILLLSVSPVGAERIKNKIYQDISSFSACFRRLNGTHQIGCSSEPKGNVGVVHYLETEADTKWLLDSGPHKPYAALLKDSDLNMHNLTRLKESGKVNGIVVIHARVNGSLPDVPDAYSPDKMCPDDEYGMYKGTPYEGCKAVKWNPFGDNMMFQDLSFPVFVLTNQSEIDFIIHDCFEKFNKPDEHGQPRQHPLCAVQLKDRMDAAKDAETCIRRNRHQMNLSPNQYCDPMGDKNVYVTVKVVNNTVERPDRSVVMAVARMDSFSIFENVNQSADNQVSGVVTLLAAAEAIGKIKHEFGEEDKDIMLTFFQGIQIRWLHQKPHDLDLHCLQRLDIYGFSREAFDYIGSGRMVYDMVRNNFPLPRGQHLQTINLNHISSIVEVNQLAYHKERLWLHTDPISGANKNISTEVDRLKNLLVTIGQSVGVVMEQINQSQPLPPASVQSFLKEKNISAVVVTNHQDEFTNRYFNSRFDTAETINASYPDSINRTDWYDHVTEQASQLAKAATVLARYLYTESTGKNSNITVDNKTVTHLLYCFLISPDCELLREVLSDDKAKDLKDVPYQFYVGVDRQINEVTALVNQLLLRYFGDIVDGIKHKDDCDNTLGKDNIYQYSWMQGPIIFNTTTSMSYRDSHCWKGAANFSKAVSMAFELDDYDWKSGKYSTWTESQWATDGINIRVFLIPSKKFEVTTLIVGLLILVLSLAGSYFLNSRAQVLFTTPDTPSSPSTVT